MPTGIYERPATNPAISKAAKKRGQTGFLHPQKQWRVTASSSRCADEWETTVKRVAMRKMQGLVKCTKEHGRYFLAELALECDGVEIETYEP